MGSGGAWDEKSHNIQGAYAKLGWGKGQWKQEEAVCPNERVQKVDESENWN